MSLKENANGFNVNLHICIVERNLIKLENKLLSNLRGVCLERGPGPRVRVFYFLFPKRNRNRCSFVQTQIEMTIDNRPNRIPGGTHKPSQAKPSTIHNPFGKVASRDVPSPQPIELAPVNSAGAEQLK